MSLFHFELASDADEVELRSIMRNTPMPGPISVALTREPNFFEAAAVEGQFHETLVCRDEAGGPIIGMGSRSIKAMFVNGEPKPVGYLSSLRVLPEHRSAALLLQGFRFLRNRHADARTRLYLTTIVEDNQPARDLLTSRRLWLPAYQDYGRFCCAAISLHSRGTRERKTDIHIRPATEAELPAVVAFLNREGRSKQFFPEYREEDFGPGGLLRGLKPDDLLLGFRNDRLIAVLAAWDQRAFRQTRIAGYGDIVRLLRQPLNLVLRSLGYPRLPATGADLNAAILSLVCIEGNDAKTFGDMLALSINRLVGSYDLLLAGFHESDPLVNVLHAHRHIGYSSRLYVVCWKDGDEEFDRLDRKRIPYLELGSL